MSDVQFEEENGINAGGNTLYSRFMPSNQLPGMVQWLLKIGIVKDQNQANYVLLTITGIFVLVTIYMFSRFVFGGERKPLPSREQIQKSIQLRLERERQLRM